MSNTDLIIAAIKNLNKLKVSYDGGKRLIEPYILYEDSKGEVLLNAYQTLGYSSTGQPAQWKNFNLSEISVIEPFRDKFQPRSDYNPSTNKYKNIIAKVSG